MLKEILRMLLQLDDDKLECIYIILTRLTR